MAAEAGVAYGLVYHYFNSKDQMLNELFSERWALLVEASKDPARRRLAAGQAGRRRQLHHRVLPPRTRVDEGDHRRGHAAANSFGRTHLPEIRQAYDLVARSSRTPSRCEFRDGVDPNFAAMVFYGAIEQLLTGWIFGSIPGTDADFQRAKQLVIETICDGLEPRPVSDAVAG